MKKLLGLDFGEKRVGMAMSYGSIVEPQAVIKTEKAPVRIARMVKKEKVEAIIIGISEGKQAKETKEFARKLSWYVKVPILFWDETLTSQEAQKKAVEARVRQSKRKRLEDAFAAAVMLQSFIEATP